MVRLGTGMREAVLTMTAKTFGCVGIVDGDGNLAGIITDGDLRRHIDDDLFAHKVDDVMTKAPKAIGPQALAAEALGRMKASKVTALFVVADGMGGHAGGENQPARGASTSPSTSPASPTSSNSWPMGRRHRLRRVQGSRAPSVVRRSPRPRPAAG